MSETTITNFRKNIFEYINSVVNFNEVIDVVTKDGSAVVISKEDYNALMETLYVLSIPGISSRVEEARNTPIEECDEFAW